MKQRIVILFLLIFIISQSFAQCDYRIRPDYSSDSPYKKRGNRCEGLYAALIGASDLSVVGFVKGDFQYELSKNEIIKIQSALSDKLYTYVRAVGIPLNTYYRLDAIISNNSSIDWKVADVLLPEKIEYWNIGIYGWRGTEYKKTYIPLNITTTSKKSSDNIYRLYLRSAVSIENIYWRYSKFSNKTCAQFPPNYTAINKSFRAGQTIEFQLPANLKGIYCIEIAAKEQNSPNWLKKIIKIIVE